MLTKLLTLSLTFLLAMPAIAALTGELPDGDSLRGITRGIGQTMLDNNISTGDSRVAAKKLNGRLPTKAGDQTLVVENLFKAAFKNATSEDFDEEHVLLKSSVEDFSAKVVHQLAVALAKGNAFNLSNQENIEPLERKAWAILRELGVDEDTFVGRASAKVTQDGDDEKREVFYFVFINIKTRKLVEFFAVEGTI